jgi:hypothetical protein
VGVLERGGVAARWASLAGCELRRDPSAGILSSEILRLLAEMTQQFAEAIRASSLSAENQHKR